LSENDVVVDRVFGRGNRPAQLVAGDRGLDVRTVVDSSFDFCALLVIVPGRNNQGWKLMGRGVEVTSLGQRSEPGLATLLVDYAPFSPTGFGVVEAFEG
jgi:hypothetical protein